ncbi:MAG: hypothetical protein P8I03_02350 [Thalassotalea sp.]|nr:hypothetical protein [Thalassotalea sp.]
MIKWLTVSLFVLSIFLIILLGFGVLLNDNEKQHESYNRKLEKTKRQQKKSNHDENVVTTLISNANLGSNQRKESTNLAIVTNNLTCVSDEQCSVVSIDFVDLTCTVAVNLIGEAQLKKAVKDETTIGRCDNSIQESKAVCFDNFCSLAPRN